MKKRVLSLVLAFVLIASLGVTGLSAPAAESADSSPDGETVVVPAGEPDGQTDAEPSVDVDAPADAEPPADEDAPADAEPPVDADAPADAEPPVDADAPADAEPPADEEPPADVDAPADEEPPADADAPADVEPSADEEPPADVEPPVDEDVPVDEAAEDEESEAVAAAEADEQAGKLYIDFGDCPEGVLYACGMAYETGDIFEDIEGDPTEELKYGADYIVWFDLAPGYDLETEEDLPVTENYVVSEYYRDQGRNESGLYHWYHVALPDSGDVHVRIVESAEPVPQVVSLQFEGESIEDAIMQDPQNPDIPPVPEWLLSGEWFQLYVKPGYYLQAAENCSIEGSWPDDRWPGTQGYDLHVFEDAAGQVTVRICKSEHKLNLKFDGCSEDVLYGCGMPAPDGPDLGDPTIGIVPDAERVWIDLAYGYTLQIDAGPHPDEEYSFMSDIWSDSDNHPGEYIHTFIFYSLGSLDSDLDITVVKDTNAAGYIPITYEGDGFYSVQPAQALPDNSFQVGVEKGNMLRCDEVSAGNFDIIRDEDIFVNESNADIREKYTFYNVYVSSDVGSITLYSEPANDVTVKVTGRAADHLTLSLNGKPVADGGTVPNGSVLVASLPAGYTVVETEESRPRTDEQGRVFAIQIFDIGSINNEASNVVEIRAEWGVRVQFTGDYSDALRWPEVDENGYVMWQLAPLDEVFSFGLLGDYVATVTSGGEVIYHTYWVENNTEDDVTHYYKVLSNGGNIVIDVQYDEEGAAPKTVPITYDDPQNIILSKDWVKAGLQGDYFEFVCESGYIGNEYTIVVDNGAYSHDMESSWIYVNPDAESVTVHIMKMTERASLTITGHPEAVLTSKEAKPLLEKEKDAGFNPALGSDSKEINGHGYIVVKPGYDVILKSADGSVVNRGIIYEKEPEYAYWVWCLSTAGESLEIEIAKVENDQFQADWITVKVNNQVRAPFYLLDNEGTLTAESGEYKTLCISRLLYIGFEDGYSVKVEGASGPTVQPGSIYSEFELAPGVTSVTVTFSKRDYGDKNGDGKVEMQEIQDMFRRLGSTSLTESLYDATEDDVVDLKDVTKIYQGLKD